MNSTKLTARASAVFCLVAALCLTASASAQQPSAQQATDAQVTAEAQEPTPTVAFSEEPALFFELRIPSFYPTDSSFDALSDDDYYSGGQLGIGYDIGGLTLPGLRAYLLYSGGGMDTERFNGDLDLSWSRNMFLAAADYGPELWGFFRPAARLGAGYALQNLEIQTTGPATDDYAHDIVGMGSLGFEVFTPENVLKDVRLSLVGEFGYQLQTTATFDEMEGGGGEFAREEASFGDLNTNGVFWSLGAGVSVDL